MMTRFILDILATVGDTEWTPPPPQKKKKKKKKKKAKPLYLIIA